jgi:hypothetical protein
MTKNLEAELAFAEGERMLAKVYGTESNNTETLSHVRSAREFFEKAHKADSGNALYTYKLIESMFASGDKESAERTFTQTYTGSCGYGPDVDGCDFQCQYEELMKKYGSNNVRIRRILDSWDDWNHDIAGGSYP